jgi:hypothetical protein
MLLRFRRSYLAEVNELPLYMRQARLDKGERNTSHAPEGYKIILFVQLHAVGGQVFLAIIHVLLIIEPTESLAGEMGAQAMVCSPPWDLTAYSLAAAAIFVLGEE